MISISVAFIIGLMSCFWLILRNDKKIPIGLKIISIFTVGILFFRTILSETYFFAPQISFQALIFILGFIYFFYLYINSLINPKINIPLKFNSQDKIFGIFILFLIISAFYSVNKDRSIAFIVYFSALFGLYKTISCLPQNKQISKLLQISLITACVLLVAYGYYQYFIGFEAMRNFLASNPEYMIDSREFIRRMKSNTVFSSFLYPPAFGSYLSMLFLTIFGFCISEGNALKPKLNLLLFAKYILLISIIPLLILTKAKGAWVALLFGLICFIIMLKPKTRNKSLLFNSILGLFGLFILSFIVISTSDKIHLPKFSNFIISLEVRWEYWKAAIEMIKQRPLFGFGPGTFGSVYPLFKTLNAEETIMAHNSYLQLGAEAGIISLLIFFIFFINLIKNSICNIKKISDSNRFICIGLFTGIISFLFINLIDFSLYDSQTAMIAFGLIGILEYQIIASSNQKTLIIKNKAKISTIFISCLIFTILLGYSVLVYSACYFDEKASEEYKKGYLNRALIMSDKAIKLQRTNAKYYFHKAIILEKMVLNPQLPLAHKNQFLNKALINFKAAVKWDEFIPLYHFKLGVALLNLGEKDSVMKAEQEFKKAAELYPVNPFYHQQLVQFYEITNQTEKKQKEQELVEYYEKFYKKGTR